MEVVCGCGPRRASGSSGTGIGAGVSGADGSCSAAVNCSSPSGCCSCCWWRTSCGGPTGRHGRGPSGRWRRWRGSGDHVPTALRRRRVRRRPQHPRPRHPRRRHPHPARRIRRGGRRTPSSAPAPPRRTPSSSSPGSGCASPSRRASARRTSWTRGTSATTPAPNSRARKGTSRSPGTGTPTGSPSGTCPGCGAGTPSRWRRGRRRTRTTWTACCRGPRRWTPGSYGPFRAPSSGPGTGTASRAATSPSPPARPSSPPGTGWRCGEAGVGPPPVAAYLRSRSTSTPIAPVTARPAETSRARFVPWARWPPEVARAMVRATPTLEPM